jgi:carboxypeptidase Q
MREGFPRALVAVILAGASATALGAPVDAGMVNRIADAEFNHGEVVETAAHLADEIGGRLTNSPAMRVAERWTQDRFNAWGLKDVHAEAFDFGRGWWIESSRVRLVVPRALELRAIPVAWTPATNGPLTASVIVAPMRSVRDFDTWKGKLAGKIVLVGWPEPPKDATEPPFVRLADVDLLKLNKYVEPVFNPEAQKKRLDAVLFRSQLATFLADEGALAWAQMSRSEGRLVHGEGYSFRAGKTPKLPGVELGAEDYRRVARLAKLGDVRLEIDSRVHFEDADHNAYNIVADIRGRDPKAGFVLAGAHLDSWVAGDGAADNGAGSAVVMEAARLLASLGAQPKRTIRFALWAGEEQGLWGSRAFIEKHLAHRPVNSNPEIAELGEYFGPDTYPVQTLPEFADLAAYFNVDHGSGKIRGIFTEGNFAVVPIFRDWLRVFESFGAISVVAEPTGSTDHVLMSRLGLPAFQFIQDPLDYGSRVHHTDLDTFDHLRPDDLREAAVIVATLLLDAANSDAPLPRKPVPTQPRPTDPFHYAEPPEP